MRENTLKQQLYAGKATFGVMCTFPSPPVVEMLGYLGFDWILLDNEHGSITVEQGHLQPTAIRIGDEVAGTEARQVADRRHTEHAQERGIGVENVAARVRDVDALLQVLNDQEERFVVIETSEAPPVRDGIALGSGHAAAGERLA